MQTMQFAVIYQQTARRTECEVRDEVERSQGRRLLSAQPYGQDMSFKTPWRDSRALSETMDRLRHRGQCICLQAWPVMQPARGAVRCGLALALARRGACMQRALQTY